MDATQLSEVRRVRAALTLCVVLVSALMPALSTAGMIDLRLVVNPVQICADVTTCANPDQELYEMHTEKVWSQAGIDVHFLDFQSFVAPSETVISLSDIERFPFSFGVDPYSSPPGSNWFDSAPGNSPDPTVVDLYFFDEISFFSSLVFGVADVYVDFHACRNEQGGWPADRHFCADNYEVSPGHAAISNAIFEPSYFGAGELVIAHELGHVLGLHHADQASSFPPVTDFSPFPSWVTEDPDGTALSNVMRSDLRRSASLDQLPPEGDFAGMLSQDQIAIARQSPFLVPLPLPSTTILLILGLAGLTVRGMKQVLQPRVAAE